MKQQTIRGIPLQWILIVPFVLQIFLAVGLTGWLSWHSGQIAVGDVANQLQNKITERIQDRTQAFLKIPNEINQINAGKIKADQLDINNGEQLIRHFVTLQNVFAGIKHISLGKEDGSYVAVRRSQTLNPNSQDPRTPDPFEILISTTNQPGKISTYWANQQGDRTNLKKASANYDPRTRPWYRKAVQAGKPGWSDIYNYFNVSNLGISHTYPVNYPLDPQNPSLSGQVFAGVLATDFDLSDIGKFLQGLTIGKTGQAFIMERNYHLVASSFMEDLFILNKEETLRIDATHSKHPLICQAATHIQQKFANLKQIDRPQQFRFSTPAGEQFLQVIPLVQEEGLDWLLVVVIPKADFMAQIEGNAYFTLWFCLGVLIISSLMGFLIYRQLSSWILKFSRAAQAIASGQFTTANPHPEHPRIRELAILARAFEQMRQQLQDSFIALEQTNHDLESRVEQRTHELQAANHTLHQLATIDALTEAANRRHFNAYLEQEWLRAMREQRPLCLILCDVDCFKLYNDTYGHQAGDVCLQQVVWAIRQVVQRPADLVARYGGEEFAIILPNTELEGAKHVAVDLLKSVFDLQIPHRRSAVVPFVTVSLGICSIIPTLELSQESLIRMADKALYDAKAAGRNTYGVRSI